MADGNNGMKRNVMLKKRIIFIILAITVFAVVLLKKNKEQNTVANPSSVQVSSTPAVSVQKKVMNVPRLVELGSEGCIPCKMMSPILDQLRDEYTGKLQVEFIDVRVHPESAKKYNIRVIPTQIFYDAAGKELLRHEGFIPKEDILSKWKELGIDLKGG